MVQFINVRTEHRGTQGGPYLSQFYFNQGVDAGGSEAAVAATVQFWTDTQNMRPDTLVSEVIGEVETIESSTGATINLETVTGGTVPGLASVDPLSWTTQGLLRLRTGVYTNRREIRGRWFLPAPCVNMNVDGAVSPNYADAYEAAFVALNSLTDSPVVVWSRVNGTVEPVVSASVWSLWAVLRSRRD